MNKVGGSILRIFIILGAVIVAGVIILRPQNSAIQSPLNQMNPKEPSITSVQTKDPAVSPTIDPAADWKTYSSDSFKLSFKYPRDYKVEERDPGFFVVSVLSEHVPQGGISIDARRKGSYQTFEEAEANINGTFTLSESIRMNDWTMYDAIGKEDMLKGTKFKIAIAPYQTGAIEMETIDTKPYADMFVKILSSFKFSP